MPARSLGYWEYVKAAFRRRARVPLLGYVPYNYLALFAFTVLGAASQNPGVWFMGGALEIGYLTALAGNTRFQKLVEGEALLKERPDGKPSISVSACCVQCRACGRSRACHSKCLANSTHASMAEISG